MKTPDSLGRWCRILAFIFGVFLALHPSAAEKTAPNIIFILTDDQGYGDISAHGNPVLRTPNLDRLHREGVRFTDFHVSPTCAPTRSALLTGRHEFKNGVTHTIYERERLALDAVTLAEVLKRGGYSTGIFGKWHLGDEAAYRPDRRGFDETFIHGGGGIGQTYPGSCGDAPANTYFNPAILHNGKFEKTEGYCTDVFFSQAIRWMDSRRGKGPFLAWIAPNAPHGPLQVRSEDEARYSGKTASTNAAKFFGMIANIDDNVGRLLDQLDKWGIEKETLVIFMNDNGGTVGVQTFNAGMRGQKGTAWLGGTRAASFWRWPGRLHPVDVRAVTAHIDVFPTLAELAGVRLNAREKRQIEGRSLVPLLERPEARWPSRQLFTHFGRWLKDTEPESFRYKMTSVREGEWQLISPDGATTPQWQLYNVEKDPGQRLNVAGEHPGIVKRLARSHARWWESVKPMMVNETVVGPPINPFKELYWRQFGGEPTPELLKQMDPSLRLEAPAPSLRQRPEKR